MDVLLIHAPILFKWWQYNRPVGDISYVTTHTASLQSKFVVTLHSRSQVIGSADQSKAMEAHLKCRKILKNLIDHPELCHMVIENIVQTIW